MLYISSAAGYAVGSALVGIANIHGDNAVKSCIATLGHISLAPAWPVIAALHFSR